MHRALVAPGRGIDLDLDLGLAPVWPQLVVQANTSEHARLDAPVPPYRLPRSLNYGARASNGDGRKVR